MDTFNPNQMPPISGSVEKKSVGPLVAVILILSLIIIGGLYFLKERSSKEVYVPLEQGDPVSESLNRQNSSDELESIEADLNATSFDSLDQGAAALEAELQ